MDHPDKDAFEHVPYEQGTPEAALEAEVAVASAEREKLEKISEREPEIKSSVAKAIAAKGTETPKDEVEKPADEPPAYVVNKKFKYLLDKESAKTKGKDHEEKEFDDFISAGIKDADTEKKVRDLYEKAYGLDTVKKERDEVRQSREQIENNFNNLVAEVQAVSQLARKKEYGRLLSELQIPKQEMAAWLIQQHDMEEKVGALPEPIRKIYNEYGELKSQVESQAKEIAGLRSGTVDSATQARAVELKSSLSAPDVASFVTAFDTRVGQQGAFEDQVMRYGFSEWQLHKRDVSAKEAVDHVLKILGHTAQAPGPVATPNEPAAKPVVIPAPKATVIPNVGAGSASSAMKRPKSLDDLRKMAKAAQTDA